MNNKLILITIFLFQSFCLTAQNRCAQGVVIDMHTHTPIALAQVVVGAYHQTAVTDEVGFFKVCGMDGHNKVAVVVRHTAYEPFSMMVDASNTDTLYIQMVRQSYQTGEVTVTARPRVILSDFIPGHQQLKHADVMSLPSILGMPDVIRAVQFLPGVQSVSEGNSGLYVRGGTSGQNFILFDDLELMNPSHIMGIYSVFNPLLTHQVDLYKGNAPIHLSNRLASSVIVESPNEKPEGYNWSGNIGNISSNLTWQGTSADGRLYANVGLRYSYLELIKLMARPFVANDNSYFEENNISFYDFNGKIRYRSGAHEWRLSWYSGRDELIFKSLKKSIDSGINWGNRGAALVWQCTISPVLMLKQVFDFSGYRSCFNALYQNDRFRFRGSYDHLRYKSELTHHLDQHLLRYGIHVTGYEVSPQDMLVSQTASDVVNFNKFRSLSSKFFVGDRVQLTDRLTVYGALGLDCYSLLNQVNVNVNMNDDTPHKKDGFVYVMPNGVFTVNYSISTTSAFKASYSYASQNLHLAPIASVPLPMDLWMPSSSGLPPEYGHQATLGYFWHSSSHLFEGGIELYAKMSSNQLLLRANVNHESIQSFDDNFFKGEGVAYGSELFLKKTRGTFQGSLSYTIGCVKQKFDNINQGAWTKAKYDRPHDLNILMTYQLNKRIDLSAAFILASGNMTTLPTGRYWLMGGIHNDYEGVNNFRMPSYHRLDLSMNLKLESTRFYESELNFSIINAYSRCNPYYIYFDVKQEKEKYELDIKAKQISLFPILPSLSWRFKF